MASVLCVQQKMSKMRSFARSREHIRLWSLENFGWVCKPSFKLGYREVKRNKENAMSITAIEAR